MSKHPKINNVLFKKTLHKTAFTKIGNKYKNLSYVVPLMIILIGR